MSRLAELQRSFQQCLLKPSQPPAPSWVRAGGRAAPERQLAVYIHAYPARLKEALVDDYPAVLMAIGDDAFEQLAQAYLDTHPSRYFSLRDFGGRLADFIAGHDDYRERPWLAELACFEWALGQSFDAADTMPADISDMAAIAPQDWPALHFDIHPSVQRLDFVWNTPGMWAAMTRDAPTPITATAGDAAPWLLWRQQLNSHYRSLAADEQAALDCLCAGGSFEAICEQLTAFFDDEAVPLRAATLLKDWLAQGLISDIRTGTNK